METLAGLELRFSDNEGLYQTLKVTPEHPIWSVSDQDWEEAGDLDLGEYVDALDGELQLVAAMALPELARVYNLEVEGAHTFFVGDVGVWVHNSCRPRFDGPKPKYKANDAHIPGRGLRRSNRKTPEPKDAESVFRDAVPGAQVQPKTWWGKNSDGQIYRYSVDKNGEVAHFSAIHGVGDGAKNLTKYAKARLDEI